MKDHIPIWEWEPGDPLDEAHLEQCPQCRRQWESRRYLDFQASLAPEPDPAPFFASRVAHRAVSEATPIWLWLEKVARKTIPVFATLALIAVLGLLLSNSRQPEPVEYAELLGEPAGPAGVEELTLDDVIYSLSLPLEESSGENQ